MVIPLLAAGGIASTIGIPCIIAFGMLWKEFGAKKGIF